MHGAVQHAVVPVPQTVHGQVLQPGAGVYVRQVPLMHCWPTVQAVPQAPQFAAFVAVFMHPPLQTVPPKPVQIAAERHRPAAHTCPVAQRCPKSPQLAGSDARVKHVVPLENVPGRQTQEPPLHT